MTQQPRPNGDTPSAPLVSTESDEQASRAPMAAPGCVEGGAIDRIRTAAQVFAFDVPFTRPPMSANDQRRAHWTRVREAKAEVGESVAWHAVAAKLPRFPFPVRVTVTWWAKDLRRRDPDAIAPFTKAALDGLVAAGVLADDDAAHVVSVSQEIRLDRERPRFTITITADEEG
ncbi:hypothetical protein AB0H71_13855 [Nocardia sp. NPDC050697]|uniref:hypothetical protein n=1 Tax=Nocardia sp. NPDC050697 TaxID=3155158 RepID=UPI003409D15E